MFLANKQRPMMVRLCLLHAAGKSGSIRNSQARWVAPGLCLPGKWEVGGPEESREFLNPIGESQGQEPRHLRARARQVWRHRWASLLVLQRGESLWPFPCWSEGAAWGLMVTPPLTSEVIGDYHLPFPRLRRRLSLLFLPGS